MVTKKVVLGNIEEAISLFGHLDNNIRLIEKECGVQVFIKHAHGSGASWPSLSVRGSPGKVERALKMIQKMREKINNDKHLDNNNNNNRSNSNQQNSLSDIYSNDPQIEDGKYGQPIYITSFGNRVFPRTSQQANYVNLMKKLDMVIAIGPAGTGKTYLAAVSSLVDLKRGRISKIVLTRPVVEAGEKLGFLPGDFYEKVNPYLKPLYDAYYNMLGPDKFRLFRDNETIEIVPLAYMRGRTFDNSYIILDEAQNTTPEQMKMFLTRMGNNSKMVITGDITQIDLENKNRSGLVQASRLLKNVEEIAIIYLGHEDVIRHHLVKKIIKAYEDLDNSKG
ncbi:MAG: PhoH family protein [bacterium]